MNISYDFLYPPFTYLNLFMTDFYKINSTT